MKIVPSCLLILCCLSSAALASDFTEYDAADIAMAQQIVSSGSCTEEQKAALDDLFDAADLSAYLSGSSQPSNAAERTLIKAASICH